MEVKSNLTDSSFFTFRKNKVALEKSSLLRYSFISNLPFSISLPVKLVIEKTIYT